MVMSEISDKGTVLPGFGGFKPLEAVRPPEFGGKYISNRWTYYLPSDPIPPEEIKNTFNADVIVVGAGTSGKAAALTAAEHGVSVIQIDRHTTYRYSGGHIAAIDSRLQKKLGIVVDKNDVCLEMEKASGSIPDQRFYRLWAEQSGAVMDWIMDMTDPEGVQTRMFQWPRPPSYDPKKEYFGDYPVCHWQTLGKSEALDHSLALNQLEKHARQKGVEIRYQTRAMQLVRQSNGRVTGVIALDKGGNFIQFNARKAIIMCTGEYGNNPWMMQKYCPHGAEPALAYNIYMTRNEDLRVAPEPLDTGDGDQMVMRIGGVMQPGLAAPIIHAQAGPLGDLAFLHVNLDGERYENEDIASQRVAVSLLNQPGKMCWQIFDRKWREEAPKMGVGLQKYYNVNDAILDAVETQTVKADTIEELARKMDVPVKTFQATVDRYNRLAGSGIDEDYGKYPARLTTIDKPPFFAGKSAREFLVVVGGLNTNIKFQPLDAGRKVIPGLYLAGNMVGNRFAVEYPVLCPGLSHGLAYVTGRLAGKYAAEEKV
jgi:fumarate reductase flavoprotein subunit